MQRPITGVSAGRRVRTLAASLAVLLAGAALYAKNVQAPSGPALTDYLVHATTVPAPSRAPAA